LGLKEDVLTTVKTFWQQLQKILKAEILSDELDYIQDGISDTIDELRTLAYNSDELLVRYQQEIVKHTGISSIKLKFILNQGYALEVTNKDIETLEKKSVIGDEKLEFQRRQTLKG
jgi:DNA mismatch repair ATPase MutS